VLADETLNRWVREYCFWLDEPENPRWIPDDSTICIEVHSWEENGPIIFYNRPKPTPTPTPERVAVEGGDPLGPNPLDGAPIVGRISAEGFDMPSVRSFVRDGQLVLARGAFSCWVNAHGAEICAVHASETDISDLMVGDEVWVNYHLRRIVDRQVLRAGEEDANALTSESLISCHGDYGVWGFRVILILNPLKSQNIPR